MQCSKCGAESPEGQKFCGSCGAAVGKPCPMCGNTNPVGQRFCAHCGVDVNAVPAGLTRDRALAWRSQFKTMGWWEMPTVKEGGFDYNRRRFDSAKATEARASTLATAFDSLLKEHGLPPSPDDPQEPWVFLCHATGADWKIYSFEVKDKQSKARSWQAKDGSWVLATRSRLACFNIDRRWAESWPYTDLHSYQGHTGKGNVELTLKDSRVIQFKVRTKGAGVAEFVGALAMFGDHPYVGYRAVDQAQAKNEGKVDFMTAVFKFIEEVES